MSVFIQYDAPTNSLEDESQCHDPISLARWQSTRTAERPLSSSIPTWELEAQRGWLSMQLSGYRTEATRLSSSPAIATRGIVSTRPEMVCHT